MTQRARDGDGMPSVHKPRRHRGTEEHNLLSVFPCLRGPFSRRGLIKSIGAVAGAAVMSRRTRAQTGARPEPPSTVTTPPRDFGVPTTYFYAFYVNTQGAALA